MPNYLLAYHGGGMAQDEAERNKVLAQWGKWFQDLGPALVDGGNPVMKAKTISSKGSVSEGGGQNPVSGYSLTKAEIVAYLERYADRFGAPIREGVAVQTLARGSDSGFKLQTTAGQIQARTVVVCTGAYQRPHRPAGTSTLPGDVFAIDVEGYRSPSALPPGRVLVVGSGPSGSPIAEDLNEAGREVVVACGRAPWAPRRLGDRDLVWWIVETGFWDAPLSSLTNPADRLFATVLATGHGGGHDLHLRTLRALRITRAGL